jgi:hypothetical protein
MESTSSKQGCRTELAIDAMIRTALSFSRRLDCVDRNETQHEATMCRHGGPELARSRGVRERMRHDGLDDDDDDDDVVEKK